ncbi:hemerythrin domain-containing protein [Frankia sp. Mgl5]|uniref:hemerythrin domain-containing protein n=1 Tax=Frankia sp. Mgl5 TaxID=2933793 RepID=UPI002010C526|nr:hemerythrin domain-containing protein [Frankia sp. Mgl5]MCK9927960.1 hemerythrin domain-containing protein [Frankia sp. Mgl5]
MLTEIDLLPLRLVHDAMRTEYGRLALAAQAPRDASHAALIEDHIALTLRVLHHHHSAEDRLLWPTLRVRAPRAVVAVDRLEAQHAALDPLIGHAGDVAIPLPERADTLTQLQATLNAHLDEEEAVAFPLLRGLLSPEEFKEIGKDAARNTSRRDLPKLYGWLIIAADETTRADALTLVPLPLRLLLRRVWGPAYQRRAANLYSVLTVGSTAS